MDNGDDDDGGGWLPAGYSKWTKQPIPVCLANKIPLPPKHSPLALLIFLNFNISISHSTELNELKIHIQVRQ